MGKIIEFSKYYSSIYFKIIKELNNTKLENYTFSSITNYANRILDASRGFNPERYHTLIVRITEEFGIKVYLEKMRRDIKGCIKVKGDTKQQYDGHEKVILVNKSIKNKYLRRFIVAHLLAYYLFDYLGGDGQEKNEYFYAEYMKQNAKMEKLANRFAMDIMMPKEIFLQQCSVAVEAIKSYYFEIEYLSRFFEIPTDIVEKRRQELL